MHASTGRFCSGSLAGIRDQDGIAADLDGELRGTNNGGADALARVPDRRQVATVRQGVAQLLGEIASEITEAAGLALVEIFGNPAGEGDGIDALVGELGRPGLGHQQPAGEIPRLPQVDEAHDQARHARGDALAVRR